MPVVEWIQEHVAVGHAIMTLVLILLVWVGRAITIRRVRSATGLSNDLRRRWTSHVRMVSLLFVLLGLMIIWGAELKTFALSVVAIAAAIVIATKELIMCVSGALLRASGRSFRIGDRVEIGAFRGDVVDQTLLTTTILEVGPGVSIHQHTGRTIVLPNSLMLTSPVVNETFFDEYVLHAFAVPLPAEVSWNEAEVAMLEAARAECAGFFEDAREHIDHLVRREGLEPLSVEPRVTLRVDEGGKVTMLVRVPTPARRKGRVEQAILRRYLGWQEARTAELKGESGSEDEGGN